ncbi:hypothetical protein DTQ70_02675 [Runella sp. SP2]|nr:hypothetical protein DTQ70_02675 [Runella sp. SP2]
MVQCGFGRKYHEAMNKKLRDVRALILSVFNYIMSFTPLLKPHAFRLGIKEIRQLNEALALTFPY